MRRSRRRRQLGKQMDDARSTSATGSSRTAREVPGAAASALPLNTVTLWVTNTIERDYRARDVFPAIRLEASPDLRPSTSLHLITAAKAEELLEDARARVAEVRKGLRTAYVAHVRACDAAIKDAADRFADFSKGVAQRVTGATKRGELWRGSKQQLIDLGIVLNGPWPGEPGGCTRWARAVDWRGYKAGIAPYSSLWPGLYEVRIEVPRARPADDSSKTIEPAKAEKARRTLEEMPQSAQEFLVDLIAETRRMVRICLDQALVQNKPHGYALDPTSLEEIYTGFDALSEAIVSARVKFDPARRKSSVQSYRAQIAQADPAFQAQMTTLLQQNARLIEGDVP